MGINFQIPALQKFIFYELEVNKGVTLYGNERAYRGNLSGRRNLGYITIKTVPGTCSLADSLGPGAVVLATEHFVVMDGANGIFYLVDEDTYNKAGGDPIPYRALGTVHRNYDAFQEFIGRDRYNS
jgi:hypothetical protein